MDYIHFITVFDVMTVILPRYLLPLQITFQGSCYYDSYHIILLNCSKITDYLWQFFFHGCFCQLSYQGSYCYDTYRTLIAVVVASFLSWEILLFQITFHLLIFLCKLF